MFLGLGYKSIYKTFMKWRIFLQIYKCTEAECVPHTRYGYLCCFAVKCEMCKRVRDGDVLVDGTAVTRDMQLLQCVAIIRTTNLRSIL